MRSATTWASLLFVTQIFIGAVVDVGWSCFVLPTAFNNELSRQSPCTTRLNLSKPFCSSSSDALDVESFLKEEERDRLSSLINERAEARARGDYAAADCLKQEILECVSLPEDVELQIRDIPRKEGGGSTWKLVRDNTLIKPMEGQTVLQLAHAALGLAMAPSERQSEDLNNLVKRANERLEQKELVELELRGRKAADSAFWFALSGATESVLFDSLTEISAKELDRYGSRSSCRSKDIWHVLERLAAAGIRSDASVEQAAMTALASKANYGMLHKVDASDLLKFHSDRCLLMIWKFSTRQRKQKMFLQSALRHWEQQHAAVAVEKNTSVAVSTNNVVHQQERQWTDLYKDPTRPLVVDIGCGFGVSLLGLAQGDDDEPTSLCDWSECNFAGVDLSGLAIGYARGLLCRWNLQDRLQFFVDSAESFMEWVIDSYPGQVRFCLVQFPTPYRLQLPSSNSEGEPDQRGNSQLPTDVKSGFMVTGRLLELIHKALRRDDSGRLLIQSNCEDVAVMMRTMACDQAGFHCVEADADGKLATQPECSTTRERIPKRTLDWISMGGERAEGEGWSTTRPILPRLGRTETEVACMVNGTPVHRCLLRVIKIETE